jgi:transposase
MVSAAVAADVAAPPSILTSGRDALKFALLMALLRQGQEMRVMAEKVGALEAERAGLESRAEQAELERDRLRQKVEELSRRAKRDSTNSSKPPSSDGLRRKPKPSSPERRRRKEQGRRPGKQKGAAGVHLAPVADPEVMELLPTHCGRCQASLAEAAPADEPVERRQVWDLPEPVGLVHTEYRSLGLVCPDCGETTRAAFPQWARAPVSYGARLHAAAVYFHVTQYLPFDRVAQVLHDWFGAKVSTGTLVAMVKRGGERVGSAVEEIQRQLRLAPVVHLDETGCHVNGGLWWAHGASTERLTLLGVDRRRGGEGMAALGVAKELAGTAVHDHWSAYWGDALPRVSGHALCNAHHLRELMEVFELYGQRWADRMMGLLLEMLAARNQAMDRGQAALDPELLAELERRYDNIIKEGWKANPRREGRAQKSRPGNLVRRLEERRWEVLRFLRDFRVPFTNNEIERDLRMVKLHEKVSGGWRSENGAQAFLRVRSYLATARKQGKGLLEALTQAFEGQPWMPAAAGP